MRDEILTRVNSDLLSVPPLVYRLIRKKLVIKPPESELELKMPHFEIMRLLSEEGTLHPAEIGDRLCLAKAQMTHLIDKLVDLDFVKREWCEHDRRAINITITEKGIHLLEEQDKTFLYAIRENTVSLSETELETLSNSLRVLRSTLLKLQ